MHSAECFLLRRGRGFELFVNVSDVIFCRTFTPSRTMRCSFLFLFRFCLDPFVAVVACCLGRVEFGLDFVLEAVRVVIHRVDGSSIPDDQMRYVILRRVCCWYTMSWEYVLGVRVLLESDTVAEEG